VSTDAETAAREALALLEHGIEREDPIMAGVPISDLFYMGGNVGTRYVSAGWRPEGRGQGEFRLYFAEAFEVLTNIEQEFDLLESERRGDLLTAVVETRFDAIRIDSTPAQNVSFAGTDYMAFELEDGAWRLVRWDEEGAAP
jgi:hypothetical protein